MAKHERWVYWCREDGLWCDPPDKERPSLWLKEPVLVDGCHWDQDGPHINYRERLYQLEKFAGPVPISDADISRLTGAQKVEM